MAREYSTDEVIAMMQAPQEDVQMLDKPASPFLDPAQINAAERELSQPDPSVPRPESIGGAISDAAGLEQQPEGSSGNAALQNYSDSQAFPVDRTPAPQRPDRGNPLLYPGKEEAQPQLPKPVYSTDEVMALYTNESQPVYSTQDVMKQMITPLYDPTAKRPSRDEYFKLKEMEKSLKESGDIEDPGAFEIGLKAVGGVLVTAADALATATFKVDPKDGIFTVGGIGVNPAKAMDNTLKQKDATVRLAGEYVKQQYNALSQGLAAIGGPKFRVKETGEFITSMQQAMDASKMGQAGGLAGVPAADDSALIDRYKQQGLTLVPVGDEDLKDWEYMQWNQKMDRDLSIHQAANTPRPPDVLYRLAAGIKPSITDYFTGRNDYADAVAPVLANESQANLLSMGIDPMVWATSGAGATTRLGISAAAKGATAETLGIMGKLAQKAVKPTEAALTRTEAFKRLVVSPAKVASAYGAAQGVAWAADKLELPSELKTAAFTAASLYGAYKAGVGVLRFTANKLPEASVILRESANATNGFDKAARQAVAANADVPYSIRERLIRPSQFVAMESTPARLAKNMELSPGTRAIMDKLSNWYVVQGVRGASAVATGAVKGAAASIPFAELMRSAGDEDSADAIYGMGAGFGAAGGAASRVMGARGRRYAQAESDIARFLTDVQGNTTGLKDVKRYNWIDTEIGRLLTDVELGAGDVSALVKNRSFDELARTAAMQGFFRDRVDFVPLNAADFALNAKGHGADGSAGYFLNAPEGERPRIFVNVEARRADVEPHEFYEAFFSSDAFSPEQKASMRAAVDQRYGADGLMARGREYAEQLIKAENSKNFPNENLVVTGDQIAAKMEQLAQDELGRGGQDALDWVRREVMVEEARLAGIDYAALRRNVPSGQNPITFIENLLGANARALGLAGVRIDPETGMAVTPEQLFKENPVAANDPKLVKQLNGYLKTYKQWLNDPQHEAPKGARIAPDGRAESLANNPNVAFYDGINGKENSIAFIDASGRVVEKTTKQRAKERKLRGQQIRNMVGSKILEPANPTFGLKRWADGRVRAGGKRLPDTMALQTHWRAHLPVIRSIEALSDAGESQQVRYFAKGNSVDKIKSARPGDIDAINREMVFDQWTTNAAGDLLAQFLDLTSVRNRAMKAIAERNPALDPANGGPGYKLQAIMDDVNQWMADKRAGKAGEATIGVPRKNVVNALINPGTNFNRGKNELAGAFGRGSSIKTLLLEGINAVSGTGRKGAAMDYNWANGNFMPDKPAPRPDMDSDVPAPKGFKPQDSLESVPTDQLQRQYEENQGYLGLSTLGMREGRPVRGGAAQTRELLRRNEAINAELERRGVRSEDPQLQRALQRRGQAMPDVPDEVLAANKTARAAGAVGSRAITPRHVAATVRSGETVLNFGAGKPDPATGKYAHSETVRAAGGIVDEFDFGANSVGALGKQYDTVMASNVLNVQSGRDMLRSTLSDIAASSKARAVMNYPESPRYLDLSADDVAAEIRSAFGAEPKIVGGTKRAPLWEVTKPSAAQRGQAMPDAGPQDAAYENAKLWISEDYARPDKSKVAPAIKRIGLREAQEPEQVLVDVWGGGVARYRRGWSVRHKDGTVAFFSDRAGRMQSMNISDSTRVVKDRPQRGQAMPDAMDKDYARAVKRGDDEALQKIVDRRAKKEGYTSPLVHHGSPADGITEFSKEMLGAQTGAGSAKLGFFFAENEKTSSSYTGMKLPVNDSDALGEMLMWTDLTPDWDTGGGGLPYIYIEDGAWRLNAPKEVDAAVYIDKALGEPDSTMSLDADMLLLDKIRAGKRVAWQKSFGSEQEYKETRRLLKELNDEEFAKFKEHYEGVVSRREYELDSDSEFGYGGFYSSQRMMDASDILQPAANRGQFVAIGLDGAYTIQPDGKDFVLKYKDATIEASDSVESLKEAANSHANNYLETISSGSGEGRIYKAYLKYKNPLVHDYKGAAYREESYYSVIMRAKKAGHDGVILKNTYDGGPKDTIHIVFEPEQIKLADPITTDAKGNIIPPSRRFNVGTADIRYGITAGALAAGAALSQEEQ